MGKRQSWIFNGGSVKTEFFIEEAEKLNLKKAIWNTGVDVKCVSRDIAVPGNFCRESSEAEFYKVNVVNWFFNDEALKLNF